MRHMDVEDDADFKTKALDAIDVLPALGAFFKLEYLLRNDLCAAIFEGDFRDADRAVSRVCGARGIDVLSCASLGQDTQSSFRLSADHQALRAVREQYHVPSYVISDDFRSILIVSDSDYYWGVAGDIKLVKEISEYVRHLELLPDDISPYLQSSSAHDQRVGAMLQAFKAICDNSVAIATSKQQHS